MKKFLCVFSLLTAITVTAFAQTQQGVVKTQQGVVKTRGRMVNGKHVRSVTTDQLQLEDDSIVMPLGENAVVKVQ